MRDIFLGKPVHWLALAVVVAALWWMGDTFLHTRNFNLFVGILLALSAGAIAVVLATTKRGDRVTREPFDDV